MIPVQVVGLGTSPADLPAQALEIIAKAQVLAGGRRLLAYFPDHPAEKVVLGKNPEPAIRRLGEMARTRRVVVLASGDPNFYGIGPRLVELLGAENVRIHPNVTAIQVAAARLKIPWHETRAVSLHGRSWAALEAALNGPGRLFIYTDPFHTPAAIAQWLLNRGLGSVRLCVLEDLGQETERITWLSPAESAGLTFSPLNVVMLEQIPSGAGGHPEGPRPETRSLHLGMPEEAYSPERGLITKAEVRAVVLAKLQLYPGQVMWDLGAGTGSVGLEASLLLGPEGRILAVEKDLERAALIAANREKFGVRNLEVVYGPAPQCLATLPDPDRVFVGGGGKALGDILTAVLGRLRPLGRVVLTAARLETLEEARRVLHHAKKEVEVVQLQVSRAQPFPEGSYLRALNPVWIVTGYGKE